MTTFYSGEEDLMEALHWFLEKNRKYPLNIICDDLDGHWDYLCWSGVGHEWEISVADKGVLGVFRGTLPKVVQQALKDTSLQFMPSTVKYRGV